MTIPSITDISIGGTNRRRVHLVIPASATPEERDAMLMDGIKSGRDQSIKHRLTHGPVHIVVVMAWPSEDAIGKEARTTGAMFVRSDIGDRSVPLGFVTKRIRRIVGGTVYLPEVS